jgi:hypothetical protein
MKKQISIIITVFFCLFLTSSCGEDPLEKRYDKKTRQADLKLMKEDGVITNEQFVALGIYFAHASYKKINLTGRTYKDLIKSAYELKEQQKNDKPSISDAEKAKLDRLKRLQNIVSIELLSIEKSRTALGKAVMLTFKWKNQSEMDIIGIKGTIGFIDIYGKVFSDLKIDYRDSLYLASTKEWKVQKSLFKESDYLYSKTIEYVKINWTPEKIIFSDKYELDLNPAGENK